MLKKTGVWIFCLLIVGIYVAQGHADIPLTFYASFDNGLKADFAKGENEPFTLNTYIKRVKGYKGEAIDVIPKDFIRFSTIGNLSMDACTIKVWIKLNWTPPFYREAFGNNVQCIWMTGHTRYPNYIALKVEQPATTNPNKIGNLVLRIANQEKKMVLKTPLVGWDIGKWREIVVTWKRPGLVKWYIDGKLIGKRNDAPIPKLSDEDMKDIYFGTNVTQFAYARLDNFDGAIDEVQIFRGFDVKSTLKQVKEFLAHRNKSKRPQLPKFKWIGKDRYRVVISLKPTQNKWKDAPVKIKIDFSKFFHYLKIRQTDKLNLNSVRLVKYSLKTATPVIYDNSYSDNRKYYRPFVMNEDFWSGNKGIIRWQDDTSDVASVYVIYFDTQQVYSEPFPKNIPMVGNGDRLRMGVKGTIGRLAVGAWGDLDVYDFDGDGDFDVWISSGSLTRCNDHLRNGHYYFENIGKDSGGKYLFAPGRKIKNAYGNTRWGTIHGTSVPQITDLNNDGQLDLLYVGHWTQVWGEIVWNGFCPSIKKWHWFDMGEDGYKLARLERARLVDWNGDGLNEIIADTHIYPNLGTNDEPRFSYKHKRPIWVDGKPIDVSLINGFRPLPVDFDGDGDLDLLFGGMLHWIMYFENVGTRTKPMLTYRGVLKTYKGKDLNIPGELIIPVAVDFDGDGDIDLLWGNENGNIGYNENIAGAHCKPKLKQTVYFQQQNPFLDSGTIVIPVVFDWDDDGDYDIITGASDQYILFYENIGTNDNPIWKQGVPLKAGGKTIQLIAGPDGSVQGRYEGHWGYNNPEIADWDSDGLPDLIVSNIRGEHIFFKNIGTRKQPVLAKGKKIKVLWGKGRAKYPPWLTFKPEKNTLVTVWRCRPVAIDWNKDGLTDYVALDYEGKLALYLRKKLPDGQIVLLPGKRIFKWDLGTSRLMIWNRKPNATKGMSGRTVLNIVDWDGDGDYDLITDGLNARLFENITDNNNPHFVDRGDLVEERMVNHNTGPYVVDWDNDGKYDLLIGAEDGHMYYFNRAYIEKDYPKTDIYSVERRQ